MRVLPHAAHVAAAVFTIITAAGNVARGAADLTLVQSVRLGDGPTTTVRLFVSGSKTRTDTAFVTTIIDTDAKTLTLLDRRAKTYAIQPYDATEKLTARDVSIIVTGTRRTAKILGHPARLFRARGRSLGVPITAEIWAAEDIARPVIATLFNGTDAHLLTQIRGLPLRVRLKVSPGGGAVPVTLTTNAIQVSTASLPPATFTVPAGFQPDERKASPKKELLP